MNIADDSKTCGAAMPTPPASAMVTRMSSISARVAPETGTITEEAGIRSTG